MTSNDRIEAALAALDKVSPGEWGTISNSVDILTKYQKSAHQESAQVVSKIDSLVWLVATMNPKEPAIANATLIAAAPDLAAEVVRLREWKDDAFCHVEISRNYLSTELKTMKDDGSGAIDQLKQLKDEADRLIAEAEGE